MAASTSYDLAIIGGGAASVAAAFELTRPQHRGKYRVSVYQMGWRLGGKGASGRGPADRIERHLPLSMGDVTALCEEWTSNSRAARPLEAAS